MSTVFTGASMSLDGYISGPNETGFEQLFKWMGNGDVEVPTANPELAPRSGWRGRPRSRTARTSRTCATASAIPEGTLRGGAVYSTWTQVTSGRGPTNSIPYSSLALLICDPSIGSSGGRPPGCDGKVIAR